MAEYTETMIAALAHEVRNPMNSIKGAALFLKDKYMDSQEISEFTGIILNETMRVENYLNEFLSFSRGIKLKMSRVNFKNYITGMIMTVKHSYPYEIDKDLDRADAEVELDGEQMRQVIINLLSNAGDAVRSAGSKEPKVRIFACVKGAMARMTVEDNGPGMKHSVLKNIFVPFFTTKDEGMGIGLSVCRAIVQRHGGKISVKTKAGQGSAFTVEIPVKRKKDKNA